MRCCNNIGAPLLALALGAVAAAGAPTPAQPSFHAGPDAARTTTASDPSLVLLVFRATGSDACRQLETALRAPSFAETAGALRLVSVDVDNDAPTARRYRVTTVPTLVLMSADDKIIARRAGAVDAAELVKWLAAGRRRAARGEWEGIASSGQLAEFATKAAVDRLGDEDLKRLVGLLGQPDPGERASVARLLVQEREAAVPFLIEGLTADYLGTRLGAAEVLEKLGGDALRAVVAENLTVAVWQGRAASRELAAKLRAWWTATGRLPLPTAAPLAVDEATGNAIQTALMTVRGEDPVARTAALAALVRWGEAALPAVRGELRRLTREGDGRGAAWLEDVRWAILVPDALEERLGRVRQTLARGTSTDRQAVADRLGKAGPPAIPALAELVNDADPLVVEAAVRALAGSGGTAAVPALTALLRVGDSNLRMTAAQALGRTKSTDAVPPLLTAWGDADEIVAGTAIAAVEEVLASQGSARNEVPAAVVAGLQQALGDPRWRIRALAAETAGKLRAKLLTERLEELLGDADGFVVRNALAALDHLGAKPAPARLAELARRLPSLRGAAVEMMVATPNSNTVALVTQLYDAAGAAERAELLATFGRARRRKNWNDLARQWREQSRGGEGDDAGAVWQPLWERAAREPDAVVRRAAASVLRVAPPPVMAAGVGPLLSDPDAATRAAAAGLVLGLVGSDWGKSNEFVTARVAGWHRALVGATNGLPAVAWYLTGDGTNGLALLPSAVTGLDEAAVQQLMETPALGMLARKLPWPAGRETVERLRANPELLAALLRAVGRLTGPVADYLFEPARLRESLEAARKNPEPLVRALVHGGYEGWSVLERTERARAVAAVLVDSSQPIWRAVGLFATGQQEPPWGEEAVVAGLRDSEPDVRAAAAQAVGRRTKDRAVLEARLGPLVSDAAERVSLAAMWWLLEPEVRTATGETWTFERFRFGALGASPGSSSGAQEERPLRVLETSPAYLGAARERLVGTNGLVAAVLLAQHGEWAGVDRLVANAAATTDANQLVVRLALVGIELSRDARYVPDLRRMAATMENENELRRVLRAARGMTGPDARALRLEINKRIRQGAE